MVIINTLHVSTMGPKALSEFEEVPVVVVMLVGDNTMGGKSRLEEICKILDW